MHLNCVSLVDWPSLCCDESKVIGWMVTAVPSQTRQQCLQKQVVTCATLPHKETNCTCPGLLLETVSTGSIEDNSRSLSLFRTPV